MKNILGTPEASATLVNESVKPHDQEIAKSEKPQEQIDWEKRFKDTQAAYTKTRQEIATLRAKLTVSGVGEKPSLVIPEERKEELEELKYSDPDKWRNELSKLESDAETVFNNTVKQMTELEHRQLVFQEFQASHPDITLTDKVVNDYVPPRITKRLENGEITFEEFLQESYEFLKAPKVIGDANSSPEAPNLSKVGGGALPSDTAAAKLIANSYKNEIY